MNCFGKENVEEKKLVRVHWVGGGKVKEWIQKHNLNVIFMSFSNPMSIYVLENENQQTENKDLLKEASERQRAPTGLFKQLSGHTASRNILW